MGPGAPMESVLTEAERAALRAAREQLLAELLATDPRARGHRAIGWTVRLLRTELAAAGHSVSERTIRRALHRLDYRWKWTGWSKRGAQAAIVMGRRNARRMIACGA